jgi:cytidine deaminase
MGYIMKRELIINYEHFDHIEELPLTDQELILAAQEATHKAHAPYSEFRVGAAARLRSGEIITAANFESEVFPSGMCAERILLYHHQTHYADNPIETIAISAHDSARECYPCGGCRQTLLDVERRQSAPLRIVMSNGKSATVVGSAESLMPFSFRL